MQLSILSIERRVEEEAQMTIKEAFLNFRERETEVREREKEEKEERKKRLSFAQKLSITLSLILTAAEGVFAFLYEMLPLYIPLKWPLLDPESVRQKVGIGWGIYYYGGGETQIRFLPQTTVLFYVILLSVFLLVNLLKGIQKNN